MAVKGVLGLVHEEELIEVQHEAACVGEAVLFGVAGEFFVLWGCGGTLEGDQSEV